MSKHSLWRIKLAAGIVYALALGLMTLPAPLQLSQRLLGNSIDSWIFYWNDWWIERALAEGHNWMFTPYLFYPQGASLIAHSNSFLSSLLALPLRPLFGDMAAHNLVILLGLWVGAMGMFLLVYDLARHPSAALLGGLIFAFTPYHLTQALAHAHLGSIHWWPFYVIFLRRALREHRVVDAFKAGWFAALTLWSGLQLALLLALWTIPYITWHQLHRVIHPDESGPSWLQVVVLVGITITVASVLSAPLILPIGRAWDQIAGTAAGFDESVLRQTDLLAYLVPPSHNPFFGRYVAPVYARFRNNRLCMPYLGYTVVGLGVAALVSRDKEARFWLLSVGSWMLLAAGSVLRLNGTVFRQISLPYRLIAQVFPVSAIRAPDRFNLLVIMSLTVAAGIGAADLAKRHRWLPIPVLFAILIEYLCIPIPMLDLPPVSPFLEQMAHEEPTYGVAGYPMGYSSGKKWLYYQTIHAKPIVEGHVSRYTPGDYAFIASQPLLRAFYQIADHPVRVPDETFYGDTLSSSTSYSALRSLEAAGVRYVLLHKSHVNAAVENYFQQTMPGLPIYEDEVLAVYDTRYPLPVYYDGLPVTVGPDVSLAYFDVDDSDESGEFDFRILAMPLAHPVSPTTCQIRLVGESEVVLTLPVTMFEMPTESEQTWEHGDLDIAEATISPPYPLDPGTYHWAFVCSELAPYLAPDTLEVLPDGNITYLRRPLKVAYGDTIRLRGYRWRTVGPELQVTLMWEALNDLHADYKVFLHLLGSGGQVWRQYDASPCEWQCPTSQWQRGDVILDQARIHLGGLPPGEYQLAAGLYVEETGERVPVQGEETNGVTGTYYVLPDVFVISANAEIADKLNSQPSRNAIQ
jgi:hypothetical protein